MSVSVESCMRRTHAPTTASSSDLAKIVADGNTMASRRCDSSAMSNQFLYGHIAPVRDVIVSVDELASNALEGAGVEVEGESRATTDPGVRALWLLLIVRARSSRDG